MSSNSENVNRKTIELCEAIVASPEFQGIQERIDGFMGDEEAKSLFQQVNEKGTMLQSKQMQGGELSEEEIKDFEKERDSLLENPKARSFVEAQNEIQQIRDSVNKYVTRTFELGRIPEEGDMNCGNGSCSCGS